MILNFSVPYLLLVSILMAAVLIYMPYAVVVYTRMQVGTNFAAPRSLFEQLPDYGKRATWAHQNSFETFMPYAAAALMAYVTGVDSTLAAGAAIAFVITRFLFSVFYILNVPLGRALMFGLGSVATLTLFCLSLSQSASV
jgi:uncharacterized MAPEG superfamily protein